MNLDRDRLKQGLARPGRRQIPVVALRPASVLVPLFERQGEDWLLLTRRTEHLPHHQGEISFPGGSSDLADTDRLVTALRETEEELGIPRERIELLGCLDDVVSVHDFHVLPVVGILDQAGGYRANPAEIAEVIELPLKAFFLPGAHHQENWRHRGRLHPVDFYQVGGYEVWGLTAAILRSLFHRAGLIDPQPPV